MITSSKFKVIEKKVSDKIAAGHTVNFVIPGGGKVYIEKGLPYLCVYREPLKKHDLGTRKLITGTASYLTFRPSKLVNDNIKSLISTIVATLQEHYGTCLIVEIWSGKELQESTVSQEHLKPSFTFVHKTEHQSIAQQLSTPFARIKLLGGSAGIKHIRRKSCCQKGKFQLLSTPGDNIFSIGIEVSPIYRHPVTEEIFPLALRRLTRQFTTAMHRSLFTFMRTHMNNYPPHFYSLGRKSALKNVWSVDQKLADFSDNLELLLNVTPVNAEKSWKEFVHSRYTKQPTFYYRPLIKDPFALKRELYSIPVDRVEDPAFSILFRDKVEELDRQITLLEDRGTINFLHESRQLYQEVDENLLTLAKRILDTKVHKTRKPPTLIKAQDFAKKAREKISSYNAAFPDLNVKVQVRDDISGILVSNGNLLLSSNYSIPSNRVDAILQHEVGTHILTYLNGRNQRLKLLSSGLSGYDALQEGIATLSEYLLGGMDFQRLRLLAARVLAVYIMSNGGTFPECYKVLKDQHGFNNLSAYKITMRVFRSGGFTKDAVYLLGLQKVFDYIKGGGIIDILYIGKMSLQHIPILKELLTRDVLTWPTLLPTFLTEAPVLSRLEKIRNGLEIIDLFDEI